MPELIDERTITAADLPDLRESMMFYAEDATHGQAFRNACLAVIAAIDQARDEDESTHVPLEHSLHRFVEAGEEECARFGRALELFELLEQSGDPATWRTVLSELVPLLSDQEILGLRFLMLEAGGDFETPRLFQ